MHRKSFQRRAVILLSVCLHGFLLLDSRRAGRRQFPGWRRKDFARRHSSDGLEQLGLLRRNRQRIRHQGKCRLDGGALEILRLGIHCRGRRLVRDRITPPKPMAAPRNLVSMPMAATFPPSTPFLPPKMAPASSRSPITFIRSALNSASTFCAAFRKKRCEKTCRSQAARITPRPPRTSPILVHGILTTTA